MKTPSSAALLGFILLGLAGAFAVYTRHGGASDRGESAASLHAEKPERTFKPAGAGASAKPEDKAPLVLTADGLPDYSNYDRDGDGDPEISPFLEVYRRVDTSAGKIDMLDNVRTFDTLDEPQLNDLLIHEAAKADDAEVRRAAREALFEHGGEKAHATLTTYLESETRAADRQELEKLLTDLDRPSLTEIRSRSKNSPTSPSPPRTKN